MDLTGKIIVYRVHALKRMFERKIDVAVARSIIEFGVVIEDYPSDRPYPSKLLLGFVGKRPIHVVIAENKPDLEIVVITVYEPDPAQWDHEFKRRRK